MSDLTFGPSFKVKRWFTGFGKLSFWWIQICIGSLMRSSSFYQFTTPLLFTLTDIAMIFAAFNVLLLYNGHWYSKISVFGMIYEVSKMYSMNVDVTAGIC